MNFGLESRVALITGAGRGLGLAQAKALAQEGAHIVINDIDTARAEQAAQEIRAIGVNAVS